MHPVSLVLTDLVARLLLNAQLANLMLGLGLTLRVSQLYWALVALHAAGALLPRHPREADGGGEGGT